MPHDAEALRFRITLLGTAWLFVGFQQTNQKFLQDLHPQVFQEYLDYLLGPNVLGLTSRGSDGTVVSAPAWSTLLSYEHEIRVQTCRLIHEGASFKDALLRAYTDPVVKERAFTTPLAFSFMEGARKRSSDYAFPPSVPDAWAKRDNSKGKGKGKKGKD